jgi:PIN domain nuclease of toxin-antitoxin system
MKLLLDTHVALWAITDDVKLGHFAKNLILAPDNDIWVSVVSLWEIAIKHSLRKEGMPISASEALDYFVASGYNLLSIEAKHTLLLSELPLHHQDPFDRLLIAQARAESMQLMSRDGHIAKYKDSIISI